MSAVGLAVIGLFAGQASATAITVNNFSFEQPNETGNDGFSSNNITDWTGVGGGTPQYGTFQPTPGSEYTAGADGLSGSRVVPDDGNPAVAGPPAIAAGGDQVAYVNGTGSLTQALSATYQANTTYTLSVYIGHRATGNAFPATSVSIALLDGSNVVGSFVLTPGGTGSNETPASGDWVDAVLNLTTGSADAFLGDDITIKLSDIATDSSQQVNFDDVTLNATPNTPSSPTGVPEPASLAILGVALAGFGVIRKRRASL